jgi:hypothetical protein
LLEILHDHRIRLEWPLLIDDKRPGIASAAEHKPEQAGKCL